MLVLLSVIVLAFITSVTTDLVDSKNYEAQINTRMLADSALNLVISQIRQASTSGSTAWISQPGLIRTYDSSGLSTGTHSKAYKLYSTGTMIVNGTFDPTALSDLPANLSSVQASSWINQPNLWTDLNSPLVSQNATTGTSYVFPIIDGNGLQSITVSANSGTTNYTYSTDGTIPDVEGFAVDPTKVGYKTTGLTPANNPVPMPVQWLYMLKDGTLLPATSVAGTKDALITDPKNLMQSGTNPIVARIAFWTDDESCKVNINTASEGTYMDTPVANTQPNVQDPGGNDPVGKSTFDPNQIYEWDLAQRGPAQREYQRYPGHPATTCLSPIIGSAVMRGLNLSTGTSSTTITPNPYMGYHTLTGTAWAEFTEYINQLAPRVSGSDAVGTTGQDYSSRGGTYRAGGATLASSGTSANIGSGHGVTVDSDRLYATVDDFFFDPKRSHNGNAVGGATSTILTPALLEKAKFFLTVNSKAPEVNIFNLPRVCMWPITKPSAGTMDNPDVSGSSDPTVIAKMTAFDKVIALCATVSGTTPSTGHKNLIPFYFSRYDALSGANDYTNSINNQKLYTYLENLTSTPFPGFSSSSGAGNTFARKYGNDCNQILTEIYDYIRCTNLADTSEDTPGNIGRKSYTQMSSLLVLDPNWLGESSQGQVVPINIQSNTGATRGIGRIATIGELALVAIKEDNRINPNDNDATMEKQITITGPNNAGTWTFGPAVNSGSGVPNSQNVLLANTGTNIYSGTPQPSNTSDYYPLPGMGGLPGSTYDPRKQTRVQFALVPYLFSPMCGFSALGNNIMLKFSNVNVNVKESVSGTPFTSGSGQLYDTGRVDVINEGESKIGGPIGCKTFVEPARANTLPTNVGSPADSVFPTGECIVTGTSGAIPYTITTSTDSQGNVINAPIGTGTWDAGTMTISGSAHVEIWAPAKSFVNSTTGVTENPALVQSFDFTWPQQVVPIPALSLQRPGTLTAAQLAAGTKYQWNYYGPFTNVSGVTYSSNTNTEPSLPSGAMNAKSGISRLTGALASGNYSTSMLAGGSGGNGGHQSSGDVIRSLPLSGTFTPSGAIIPIQGDFRIIAASATIPDNWYFPFGPKILSGTGIGNLTSYYDPARPRAYGFKSFVGDLTWQDPTLGFLLENTQNSTFPHPPWQAQNSNPTYSSPGVNNWQSYVPEGITGVYNYNGNVAHGTFGSGTVANEGDWDNGPGLVVDGAYCNKADEGTVRHYEAGSDFVQSNVAPYIGHAYALEDAAFALPTLFAPNRQISSPVMFGSLPTGVIAQHPWQTLLFRPAKQYFPGGIAHAGASVAAAGGVGPSNNATNTIPYFPYAILPDHLLLDLFWMPVVDPYPISEPFATAGKVNLNYQIAPFTYITRKTALRSVLQSVKITAINPTIIDNLSTTGTFSKDYKNGGTYDSINPATPLDSKGNPNYDAAGNGGGLGVCIRRNIDIDSTLRQIDELRFGIAGKPVNKPFITASEICDVPLIPGDLPTVGNAIPYNIGSQISGSAASTYDKALNNFWWGNPSNTANSAGGIPQFGHRGTGDNSLERPYALLYSRLTTKSNVYTVHVRVQTLKKSSSTASTVFKDGQDQVLGEFRGSFVIERYLDPATTGFYVNGDITQPTTLNGSNAQLGPYKFRVVSSKQFGQ